MTWRSLKSSFCCALLSSTVAVSTASAPTHKKPIDEKVIEDKVEALLKQMSLQEKVDMCHGGSDFATKAIPRLGIRAWEMTDGPGGVRTNGVEKSTYFPTGISLSSTWDPDLIYRTGQAMGQEARFYKKDVLLGPAVNMIRTPLGGRTFEYMSEDPFLAGSLAVPYIKGVQSQGVAACIKHFAANSQEIDRGTIDALVSERALQEIYLPAFKAGVMEGHVLSVMSAYNRLNSPYCTASSYLQNQILKQDWGFKGTVMSDWGATHDTVAAANGGLDIEMPGSGPNDFFGNPLRDAVEKGKVPISTVDDKVRRTLRAILMTDARKIEGLEEANSPAHQSLAREIANEAITLLKNEHAILPLDPSRLKSIAVIGPWATAKHGGGGGSSTVFPPYEVTALEGIRKHAHGNIVVKEAQGSTFGDEPLRPIPSLALHPDANSTIQGLKGEYFANVNLQGTPKATRIDSKIGFNWTGKSPISGLSETGYSVRWTGIFVSPKDGTCKLGTTSDDGSRIFLDDKLLVDNWGDHGLETKSATVKLKAGVKHKIRVEFYQAGGDSVMTLGWFAPFDAQKTMVQEAVELAKRSEVALVFVGTNHSWDSEGWDKPSMKLMGDQEELVQAVSKANPRTVVVLINGSPVEVGSWITKVPAVVEAWFPGMEGGNSIADVLFGVVNPSGKLPVTFPVKLSDIPAHANGNYPGSHGKLKYDEGIYVGYRYFDTKKVAPQFPFGFGLSYTSFKYDNLRVSWKSSDSPVVRVDVTNIGNRRGAEVAQLYVHEQTCVVDRPEKELKGYQKVNLAPGQTRTIQIALDRNAFAYFNPNTHKWTVDTSEFDILVGSSSRDIRLKKTLAYPQGSQ